MKLNNKIILASQSPRRKNLLKQLGLKKIQIIKHSIDESKFEFKHPISKSILDLAQIKAESVIGKIKDDNNIIIAGDTLVFRAGKIFHKTDSKEKIKYYLKTLSSRKHFVFGGICVILPKRKVLRRFVSTEVYFCKIKESDLEQSDKSYWINRANTDILGAFLGHRPANATARNPGPDQSNVIGLSKSIDDAIQQQAIDAERQSWDDAMKDEEPPDAEEEERVVREAVKRAIRRHKIKLLERSNSFFILKIS